MNISLITDHDAGAEGVEPVTNEEVIRVFNENNSRVKELIYAMIPALPTTRDCACAARARRCRLLARSRARPARARSGRRARTEERRVRHAVVQARQDLRHPVRGQPELDRHLRARRVHLEHGLLPDVPEAPRALRHGCYWALGVATALLFFASILAHELSHSLVTLAEGGRVDKITLFIFGGVAEIAGRAARPRAGSS